MPSSSSSSTLSSTSRDSSNSQQISSSSPIGRVGGNVSQGGRAKLSSLSSMMDDFDRFSQDDDDLDEQQQGRFGNGQENWFPLGANTDEEDDEGERGDDWFGGSVVQVNDDDDDVGSANVPGFVDGLFELERDNVFVGGDAGFGYNEAAEFLGASIELSEFNQSGSGDMFADIQRRHDRRKPQQRGAASFPHRGLGGTSSFDDDDDGGDLGNAVDRRESFGGGGSSYDATELDLSLTPPVNSPLYLATVSGAAFSPIGELTRKVHDVHLAAAAAAADDDDDDVDDEVASFTANVHTTRSMADRPTPSPTLELELAEFTNAVAVSNADAELMRQRQAEKEHIEDASNPFLASPQTTSSGGRSSSRAAKRSSNNKRRQQRRRKSRARSATVESRSPSPPMPIASLDSVQRQEGKLRASTSPASASLIVRRCTPAELQDKFRATTLSAKTISSAPSTITTPFAAAAAAAQRALRQHDESRTTSASEQQRRNKRFSSPAVVAGDSNVRALIEQRTVGANGNSNKKARNRVRRRAPSYGEECDALRSVSPRLPRADSPRTSSSVRRRQLRVESPLRRQASVSGAGGAIDRRAALTRHSQSHESLHSSAAELFGWQPPSQRDALSLAQSPAAPVLSTSEFLAASPAAAVAGFRSSYFQLAHSCDNLSILGATDADGAGGATLASTPPRAQPSRALRQSPSSPSSLDSLAHSPSSSRNRSNAMVARSLFGSSPSSSSATAAPAVRSPQVRRRSRAVASANLTASVSSLPRWSALVPSASANTLSGSTDAVDDDDDDADRRGASYGHHGAPGLPRSGSMSNVAAAADDDALERRERMVPVRLSRSGSVSVPTSTASSGSAFAARPKLPTVANTKSRVPCISPATLDKLLAGAYSRVGIDDVVVVDCRFRYEYEGGRIERAVNIDSWAGFAAHFLKPPVVSLPNTAIVVHCEFSQMRGPGLSRLFREWDRKASTWPDLHFPEVYLLAGGYKSFFEQFPARCLPRAYVPMRAEQFRHELLQKKHSLQQFESESRSRSKSISREKLKRSSTWQGRSLHTELGMITDSISPQLSARAILQHSTSPPASEDPLVRMHHHHRRRQQQQEEEEQQEKEKEQEKKEKKIESRE
jgi:rhodanese-related sulfurtransferase